MSIDFSGIPLNPLPSRPEQVRPDASPLAAAREFEAIFIAQLLRIMRESGGQSDAASGTAGNDIYTSMLDQEMARALASKGGLGLADLILGQWGSIDAAKPKPEPVSENEDSLEDSARRQFETVCLDSSAEFRFSSGPGWRRDPFNGEWQYHRGVDLAAAEGSRVGAVADGKVTFSGTDGGYGKTIVVQNEEGLRTRYAHLSELSVRAGEEVSRGQEIGKVGSTGRSTGPHLHLEMEKKGRLLDPVREGYLR